MGRHGVVYVTAVRSNVFHRHRRKLKDSGPEAKRLMQAPTQNRKTKTGRLEENALLDDFCLQLCPAFELLVCPDVSGY